jgi:hypothetical protein
VNARLSRVAPAGAKATLVFDQSSCPGLRAAARDANLVVNDYRSVEGELDMDCTSARQGASAGASSSTTATSFSNSPRSVSWYC